MAAVFATVGFQPVAAQQSASNGAPPAATIERPSAKQFGRDLVANFGGLFSKQNLPAALVGGGLAGVATLGDAEVESYFLDHPGGSWTKPGNILGSAGSQLGVTAGLFLLGRTVENQRFQDMSYSLAQGLILNTGVTGSLKLITRRERPDGSNKRSFPSGHTSGTFMAATVFTHYYGWKAALPAYAVASYVGVTRLADNKHHLSDVVAGAVFGFIAAKTACRRTDKNRNPRFTWRLHPIRKGVAVTVAIRLPQ